MKTGIITKVAGPLVIAEGMRDANMFDVVRVSEQRLIGEIIEMHGDRASVQVYEETSGLGPGEKVESTGAPLSVELGPGLIGAIYDGIQRPLDEIMKVAGTNLKRGVDVPALDHSKKWKFSPTAKIGDKLTSGDILGTVQETAAVLHKILVPNKIEGELVKINEASHSRRAALRLFPARSVQARPSFSTSSLSGLPPTSSFTSAAASAATR